jgi:hypothetical protein
MRSLSVALAIACVACSSSTGVDNTRRPGPSIKGMWEATDTLQRIMVLNLTQNDTGGVEGSGNVDADRLTALGSMSSGHRAVSLDAAVRRARSFFPSS